ncbi:MAG TPA: thioredoxin [Ruminococcaceae bacterium]|nr:thioredoxin [Oscillospiraceae bacterium]
MAEITLNKDNFTSEVLESDKPVLVDFWAEWCGPCRMLAPVVEEIAEEFDGSVKVGKVNIDEEPELANKYRVEFIPTLIVFRNGKPESTSTGYVPKEKIEEMLG